MTQSLWIRGPLPSLNDMLKAAKSGHGKGNAYARMKAEWTDIVWAEAKSKRYDLSKMTGIVDVVCTWYETRRKRDPDNIHAGIKFLLDGLVKAGILATDTSRTIGRVTHEPIIYSRTPGVLITLIGERL